MFARFGNYCFGWMDYSSTAFKNAAVSISYDLMKMVLSVLLWNNWNIRFIRKVPLYV